MEAQSLVPTAAGDTFFSRQAVAHLCGRFQLFRLTIPSVTGAATVTPYSFTRNDSCLATGAVGFGDGHSHAGEITRSLRSGGSVFDRIGLCYWQREHICLSYVRWVQYIFVVSGVQ